MSEQGQPVPDTSFSAQMRRREEICDRFDAAWQDGQHPAINDYLPTDAAVRRSVLEELVQIDLERRLKIGEAVRVESYLQPFPELASDQDVLLKLIRREVDVRRRTEPNVSTEEYLRRFPSLQAEIAALLGGDEVTSRSSGHTVNEEWGSPSAGPANAATMFPQLATHDAELPMIPGYQILERLGEGGMGRVFKARHLRMDRVVAVKTIRKERLADEDAVRRFQREAKAASRLAHPHIVTVFDADQCGEMHYLVMEYIEGVDLAQLVRRSGPLAVDRACDYVRQASLGLQHAYERGLVHRDIKPGNLILTAEGNIVKILDLGLARLARLSDASESSGALTHEGSLLGTPDYMAPEQALDPRSADIRADIYSLGCTLYFLLTGQPPFPGGTYAQKLLWHQQADPPSIASLRADVPQELVAILSRMKARRPEERYPIPEAVAAVLQPFSEGESRPSAKAETRERFQLAEKVLELQEHPPNEASLSLIVADNERLLTVGMARERLPISPGRLPKWDIEQQERLAVPGRWSAIIRWRPFPLVAAVVAFAVLLAVSAWTLLRPEPEAVREIRSLIHGHRFREAHAKLIELQPSLTELQVGQMHEENSREWLELAKTQCDQRQYYASRKTLSEMRTCYPDGPRSAELGRLLGDKDLAFLGLHSECERHIGSPQWEQAHEAIQAVKNEFPEERTVVLLLETKARDAALGLRRQILADAEGARSAAEACNAFKRAHKISQRVKEWYKDSPADLLAGVEDRWLGFGRGLIVPQPKEALLLAAALLEISPTSIEAHKLKEDAEKAIRLGELLNDSRIRIESGAWELALKVAEKVSRDFPEQAELAKKLFQEAIVAGLNTRIKLLQDADKESNAAKACDIFKRALAISQRIEQRDKSVSGKLVNEVLDQWERYGRRLLIPHPDNTWIVIKSMSAISPDDPRIRALTADAERAGGWVSAKKLVADFSTAIGQSDIARSRENLSRLQAELDRHPESRSAVLANLAATCNRLLSLARRSPPSMEEEVYDFLSELERFDLEGAKVHLSLARAFLAGRSGHYKRFLESASQVAEIWVSAERSTEMKPPTGLELPDEALKFLSQIKPPPKSLVLRSEEAKWAKGCGIFIDRLLRLVLPDLSAPASYQQLIPGCRLARATGHATPLTLACLAECLVLQRDGKLRPPPSAADLEEARQVLASEAVVSSPEPYVTFVRGLILQVKEEYLLAAAKYQEAFKVRPLGQVLSSQKRSAFAAEACYQAGKLSKDNPQTALAYQRLANALLPKPQRDYQQALLSAAAELRSGDFGDLVRELRQSKALDVWKETDFAELGGLFVRWADMQATKVFAEEVAADLDFALQAALKKSPEDAKLNLWMGKVYWRRKADLAERQKAYDCFGRVLAKSKEPLDEFQQNAYEAIGNDARDRLAAIRSALPEERNKLTARHTQLLLKRLVLILENSDLLKEDSGRKAPIFLADAEDVARLEPDPAFAAQAHVAVWNIVIVGFNKKLIPLERKDYYQQQLQEHLAKLEELLLLDKSYRWPPALVWAAHCRDNTKDPERAKLLQKMIDRHSKPSPQRGLKQPIGRQRTYA